MKKEKILKGQQIKACLQWERQAANPQRALKQKCEEISASHTLVRYLTSMPGTAEF